MLIREGVPRTRRAFGQAFRRSGLIIVPMEFEQPEYDVHCPPHTGSNVDSVIPYSASITVNIGLNSRRYVCPVVQNLFARTAKWIKRKTFQRRNRLSFSGGTATRHFHVISLVKLVSFALSTGIHLAYADWVKDAR